MTKFGSAQWDFPSDCYVRVVVNTDVPEFDLFSTVTSRTLDRPLVPRCKLPLVLATPSRGSSDRATQHAPFTLASEYPSRCRRDLSCLAGPALTYPI
jgi:hypothetical protein